MSASAQLVLAFFALCAAGAVAALAVPGRWSAIVLARNRIARRTDHPRRERAAPRLQRRLPHRAVAGAVARDIDARSRSPFRVFLFVTGLVFLPVSIFSGVYLAKYAREYSLRYFSILYHALFASIVLVLIADDAISFLSRGSDVDRQLSSGQLSSTSMRRARAPAYVMLAMSEAGTIAVVMALILIARPRAPSISPASRGPADPRSGARLGHVPAVVLRFRGQGGPGSGQQLACRSRIRLLRPTSRRCCRR